MPIGPNSTSIRIFLAEEDVKYRKKFKQLVAEAEVSMSRRMAILIKKDIEYWEATGKALDWDKLDIEALERFCQANESLITDGHHSPQQAKVTKPPKYHKTYKGQAGKDGDLDLWDEDGDLDIGDEDIKGDLQLSNQGNSRTNSYDFPQVKVTNPQRNHKRYKNKVGDLVSQLDSTRIKVNFDGDIETFHSDEIEIVG